MVLGIGKKSVPQQQQAIHAGEAYEVCQHLVMRYDTQELATVFHNFINDVEFKTLLSWGLGVLIVPPEKRLGRQHYDYTIIVDVMPCCLTS
jgi:hypothetical protein